jgi:hypothetical protein
MNLYQGSEEVMRKLKHIASFAMSLLLMFSILALQVCIFTRTKVLNGDFYKDRLNHGSYFSSLKQELGSSLKNLSVATAIPEDIFASYTNMTYLKEATYKNIMNTINYIHSGQDNTQAYVDVKSLETDLNKYLDNYASKNKLLINADMRNQMTVIAQEVDDIITNHVELFNIGAVSKYSEFQKFRKALYIIADRMTMVTALITIILIILTLVNMKSLRIILLWAGSGFIPAALIILIPTFMALIYRLPYRLSITNGYLNEALKVFSLGFIYYLINVGIIYLVVGIAMLVIYSFINRKIKWTKK